MPEQLLDVLSKVNDEGVPYLGTCTMVVGDGTTKVDFTNGRAKAPAHVARLVAQHPEVEVPGLSDVTDEELVEATPEEEAAKAAAESDRESEFVGDEAALEAAREHLAEEGEEVPDIEVADTELKPGFEATNGEGQPRCQAAKADGNQCANPASAGQACRLPKHQEQLAA